MTTKIPILRGFNPDPLRVMRELVRDIFYSGAGISPPKHS